MTTYAAWGGLALVGALAVTFAASLGGGPAAETAEAGDGKQPVVVRSDPTLFAETQRLAEAVRTLTADRERLVARLDQMERTLGDVTAAIPRDRDAGAGPAAARPTPIGQMMLAPLLGSATPLETVKPASAPSPQSSAPEPPESQAAQQSAAEPGKAQEPEHRAEHGKPMPLADFSKPGKPVPAPAVPQPRTRADASATDSVGTRTEFAIDIGSSASIEGLRAMWSNIRTGNGQLLDGLHPLVAVRDGPRQGTVELRLIVGPLANASSAARLCAALSTTGVACQPTQFNGQKLALY